MLSFPKYETYQDSGVEWLGKIPKHWKVQPGRAYLQPQKTKNTGNKVTTVLSLSYGRIVVKPEEKLHGLVPESFETYQIVEPGNIIVRATDLQNDQTSLRIGLVRDKGIITSAYLCLVPSQKMDSRFTYYLLHAYDLLKVYYSMGSGLRQNLDYIDFKYLPLPIPELEEQKRIVEFLDRKTFEIDQAIAQKQRLIELLQEQKSILINQAVTKGLNPSALMRDSGIEWIGNIPAHWSVVRNRYLLHDQNERSIDGSEVHLSMSQKFGLIPSGELTEKTLQSESYEGAKLCKKGDLVLNRLKAHLGVFSVAPCDGLVSPDYSVFRIRYSKMIPEYFEHLFKTSQYISEFNKRVKGIVVGFYRLYTDAFYDIFCICPPEEEQAEIKNWLSKIQHEFKTVEDSVNYEIEKLMELKTVFISNAVTGKLKV